MIKFVSTFLPPTQDPKTVSFSEAQTLDSFSKKRIQFLSKNVIQLMIFFVFIVSENSKLLLSVNRTLSVFELNQFCPP